MNADQVNELSNRIIGCAIKVHKALGPGFIEKTYSKALSYELEKNHIEFARELSVQIRYEGQLVGEHRLDFLIEGEVILEVKAMYEITNFHLAQVLSYLNATGKKLGLILNFSRPRLQIKRVAHGL